MSLAGYNQNGDGPSRVLAFYQTGDGVEPFTVWLESLKDPRMQNRVVARLDRVETGNLGDHRLLGDGLFELRLHFGPGYRVYCGDLGRSLILLLVGGHKGTQRRDIGRARRYWREYRGRRQ